MMIRELFLVITLSAFAVAVIVLLISAATSWRKRAVDLDRRRLDVLEQALQHPALDEATRAELLRVLAAGRQPDAPTPKGGDWWHLLWYGPAWILFVLGGCMLGAHALSLAPGLEVKTFLPMTVTGFAMLSLPMALRELQVRRDRAAATER